MPEGGERTAAERMRSPNKVARLLLAFVVGSTIFADYWEYSRAYHGNPDWWMDVIRGTADAPQQYRIGVPWAADLLRRYGHMGLRHGLTLIDLLSAVVAVYLLYSLFERSRVYREASEPARWFGAAAFVLLAQLYFAWITWYQRPETMASAAVVAATLWLLTVRLPLPGIAGTVATSAAMLVLAGIQGFIRADVIFAVHLGVLLVCATRAGDGLSLARGVQAATSAAAVLIAGGIQVTLMHVVYPHAGYGATRVFELGQNLANPLGWVPFVLFMLPWGWLVATLARRHVTVDAPSMAMLVGSVIYVAMWLTVGRMEEVRIFLPFAVALIPATCWCAMRRFVGGEEPGQAAEASLL
jgi:hypothetical protein